jgi:hypothetical protein
MRTLPQQLQASGMFLNGKLVSALIHVVSREEAHLAIPAHAPEHAGNSPNKLHIYEAGLALLGKGVTRIDFTPGGDEWKERFASASDEVCELVFYASRRAAAFARMREAAARLARASAARIGVAIPNARAGARRLADRLINALRHDRQKTYRLDPGTTPLPSQGDGKVEVNPLAGLLRFGAGLTGLSRRAFLRTALKRIEAGERCYAVAANDGIACLGWAWTRGKDAAAVLFDFAAAPGTLARTYRLLVGRMVSDVGARLPTGGVYLVAPSGAAALHEAVVAAGFRPCAAKKRGESS